MARLTYSGDYLTAVVETEDNAQRDWFAYDACGNTTSTGIGAQGQLLTATGGGNSYSYIYNTVGNILTARWHPHTYTYGDAAWRDKLTAFDGHGIV